MLHRPLILMMLLLSISLFGGEISAAPEHLVIVYAGDTRGYVEGCG